MARVKGITQFYLPPTRLSASVGSKGWILTSAGWQVTPCDPVWHVSFP